VTGIVRLARCHREIKWERGFKMARPEYLDEPDAIAEVSRQRIDRFEKIADACKSQSDKLASRMAELSTEVALVKEAQAAQARRLALMGTGLLSNFVLPVESVGPRRAGLIEVYGIEVEFFHNYFVGSGDSAMLVHNGPEYIKRPAEANRLLANEGKVGTFNQLDRMRVKGDNLTPHHLPSDAFMKARVPGYTRGEGIAMDLPRMLAVFTDECQHHEVMYGLVHLVESFENNKYFQALVQAVPSMRIHAPEWTNTLHYGILNDPASREAYKKAYEGAPLAAREAVRVLLLKIQAAAPEFSTRVRELIS
jgi:hypothetical protein